MTEPRKYEVTLEDGRTVSRQYAHQLAHPEVYRRQRRKYYLKKRMEQDANDQDEQEPDDTGTESEQRP